MRPALLSLLLVAAAAANAHARLGETPDQLVNRYGQPLSEVDQKAENGKVAMATAVFQKGGIEISISIVDGVSAQESFRKLNGEPFTNAEAQILLNANAQGQNWEAPQRTAQGAKVWTRDDNATARIGQDGVLVIKSRELISKESTAKKEEKRPTLDGF